ncbi:MAG TPA: DUF222 domain-containing protein, partial [Nakamurella sp.]|nr:DUF222 domain-containing protein [Nakamurella sp.]
MQRSTQPTGRGPVALIDELVSQQGVLAQAQARNAALMLEFSDARRSQDRQAIAERKTEGHDPRYRAGEFAAMEIALAMRASKHTVQRTMSMARRLQQEAPDAWDCWQAGDIDHDKAIRINRALRRLLRDASKDLLNTLVVDVAACRTPELLGRWLNQFIARVEPDQQNERMHRCIQDRHVSIRPDIDGISFLSAAISSVDATAADQVLTVLAATAGPGDPRTRQQRRADALVDVLLGRVSNGCQVTWDTNDDSDDHLDDSDDPESDDGDHSDDHDAAGGSGEDGGSDADPAGVDRGRDVTDDGIGAGDNEADGRNGIGGDWDAHDWDAHDWELPASAFRPDPHGPAPDLTAAGPNPHGRPRITPCPGGGRPRPLPVTVGVVVSWQSLFGLRNTPASLMDRTASVPADTIRDLAAQPGTLFYRLLTDERGNLLDATEMGRFPSRKLGLAIRFRDGVCANPSCTVPAARCDLDHLIPVPD